MIKYEMVAMFADGGRGGSRLAVVPGADGLSTEHMESIAARLGTTETAFVLTPNAPAASYRVRIFTPTGESPFGSHAALGAAVTLARLRIVPEGTVVQECGTRLLTMTVDAQRGVIGCRDALACGRVDAVELAEGIGLTGADLLDGAGITAGFGPLFHYLPIRPDALRRVSPDAARMGALGFADAMAFAWDGDARRATARLFAPGYGMPEDPACAPVALGLGVFLVSTGRLPTADGTYDYEIRQGAGEHTGLLSCTVTVAGGQATAASVSGVVAAVDSGAIALPGSGNTDIDFGRIHRAFQA